MKQMDVVEVKLMAYDRSMSAMCYESWVIYAETSNREETSRKIPKVKNRFTKSPDFSRFIRRRLVSTHTLSRSSLFRMSVLVAFKTTDHLDGWIERLIAENELKGIHVRGAMKISHVEVAFRRPCPSARQCPYDPSLPHQPSTVAHWTTYGAVNKHGESGVVRRVDKQYRRPAKWLLVELDWLEPCQFDAMEAFARSQVGGRLN